MSVLRAKTLDLRQTRELTLTRHENSLLNEDEATAQVTNLVSMPRRLVFELTNACNLNCVMCGRNSADFRLTRFDYAWVDRFSDVVDRIEEVTLMGWGEPTIHPDFKRFLLWAYKCGLRKYFCTNGMTLDRLCDDIFDYEVDIIAVSLDGANAETNNRIRRGSSFDTIVANVSGLVERRKKLPYVNFVYTLMRQNIEQFPDFVRMAATIGVDEVKGVYLTAFDAVLKDQVLFDDIKLIERVFGESMKIADDNGISLKLPHVPGDDPAGERAHKKCYTAWRDFFLGSDGFVRPCMSTSDKLFHIDKYNGGFELMWNAQEFIRHRERVNSPMMSNSCASCYQSSYANWNKKESFLRMDGEFSPDWAD